MSTLLQPRAYARCAFFPAKLCFSLLFLGAVGAMGEPPTVAVSPITRGDGFREVTFDAELRPYREIDIHAKVTPARFDALVKGLRGGAK